MSYKKIWIALLIAVFLAGCVTAQPYSSSSSQVKDERSLQVANLLRFEDVPVPAGYNILGSVSFAFQNDRTRVALLKYEGARLQDQVVLFYKEQMPLYSWHPINIIEYDRRILNYEKNDESCIVTVEPKGRKNIVTIAISPKSKPMKIEKEK